MDDLGVPVFQQSPMDQLGLFFQAGSKVFFEIFNESIWWPYSGVLAYDLGEHLKGWLVVWNIYYFSIQLGIDIPTDSLIFFRGVGSTTNQSL